MNRIIRLLSVFIILGTVMGCGGGKAGIENKVPLVKVRGVVQVNGKPYPGIVIKLEPQKVLPEKRPQYVILRALTNEKGEFDFTTYEPHDGIPECDYKVYSRWDVPKIDPLTNKSQMVDNFGFKYYAKDSPVKSFTATGTEVDLGVIELQADSIPTGM